MHCNLRDSKHFTTLDVKTAYNEMEIVEESKEYTTILTPKTALCIKGYR